KRIQGQLNPAVSASQETAPCKTSPSSPRRNRSIDLDENGLARQHELLLAGLGRRKQHATRPDPAAADRLVTASRPAIAAPTGSMRTPGPQSLNRLGSSPGRADDTACHQGGSVAQREAATDPITIDWPSLRSAVASGLPLAPAKVAGISKASRIEWGTSSAPM